VKKGFKMKKYITPTLIIVMLLLPAVSVGALNFGNAMLTNFGTEAGYGEAGMEEIIGTIIQIVLSLLGLVAVVLIIAGGFQWMTSGGNEEKIKSAKKLMGSALVGLIIVILAYSIATFIISRLAGVTAA